LARTPAKVAAPPGRLRGFPAAARLLRVDLQRLFEETNRRRFGGRLPRTAVRWSTRLKVAGQIVRSNRLILLGLEYHCHYPRDLRSSLKHEMVHLLHWDHDEAFRRECRRVGAAIHCRTYPGIFRPLKYVYQCPGCGMRHAVRRRIHAACARCGKGFFRGQFRMRLVEYLSPGAPAIPAAAGRRSP
jgi:predicted SprT family Zn-dependent metalloprotease